MSSNTYNYLRIHGPVSVEPTLHLPPRPDVKKGKKASAPRADVDVVLLMGLTGVGKSTFIECLCGPGTDLAISKNQLEGFTKDIMAYRVTNINMPIACFLLDTPGFADSRVSEMSIVLQIQEWMKTNDVYSLNAIMYFDRITDIRMHGSKGRSIELFKTLMGKDAARSVTIVTTMWDQLWNEGQKILAERRFQQLEEHWKEFIALGSPIVKFTNTRQSALDILDRALERPGYWAFEDLSPSTRRRGNHNRDKPFGLGLYQNLCNRIDELHRQRSAVEFDLNQEDTKVNEELVETLNQRWSEIDNDLQAFEQELHNFLTSLPPLPLKKGKWHCRYDSLMGLLYRALHRIARVPSRSVSAISSFIH